MFGTTAVWTKIQPTLKKKRSAWLTKSGLKAAFFAGLLRKNGYSEKRYGKLVSQCWTYCGRNTILSLTAEKLCGNIQWFEKFVEVNSCTLLNGKVYNFGRPRTKRAKKNGKDYSSNGQKVQFQKTFSIEYFRKLTDLWNCKLPSVFHWKLVFADTKKKRNCDTQLI